MKAIIDTGIGIKVEVEAETTQGLFEAIADAQEVFSNIECKSKTASSKSVRFQVRKDKEDNKYYEYVCTDPTNQDLKFAKFAFGCNKKGGGLFPKNKNWVKWNKDQKVEYDLVTGEPIQKKDEE